MCRHSVLGRPIPALSVSYTKAVLALGKTCPSGGTKRAYGNPRPCGTAIAASVGSLTGQRTLTIIVLIGLEIIVTPILAAHVIPYFIDGQRLAVGVALDQLRPAALGAAGLSGGGPGGFLFGGRGALDIPLMPTWAMISVIVGWIVGWSGIGAWRMMTRDA